MTTINVYQDLDLKNKTVQNTKVDYGIIPPINGPASNTAAAGLSNYFSDLGLKKSAGFSVVGFNHGGLEFHGSYNGSVFSPTQNRIYFCPRNASPQSTWFYVDCVTGNYVEYKHDLSPAPVSGGYGGAYIHHSIIEYISHHLLSQIRLPGIMLIVMMIVLLILFRIVLHQGMRLCQLDIFMEFIPQPKIEYI
jgi:hypothetical protein